ncbi:rab effector MyRIP isoform X2 [Astyanax mexicanus]|uniref:rab effector MyRIP isoform X2 n=1 Tax=Astyanax mexicanus TaxID=7994 RepID=UPI0020CACDB2|nr:rab effector MyRIP isoform X2 [Astyanax mexicanus]
MGRKLDLSGLTDDEAEHVLRVVQRDMKLRKKEEERLSDLKQELEEEGSRCMLLVKQHRFNEQCCIRCCQPFSFLLNPRRACLDCTYNVCKACCSYNQQEKGYVCTACQKTRLLRTQSLEWYYNNVKSRFKRFGSAKVLKTLYRKHIIERGALSELPADVSAPEGSNDNDGSVCGSDSPFYKHSEGHSMAETLTVALRVAEEAIEEAIAKAESYRDSLEKQNEARYLRDHKEELIEELATTIVQKIIQRGKRTEIQAEYDLVWSQAQNSEIPSPTSASNTHTSAQHTHTAPQHSPLAQASVKSSYSLWRSRSAFSLTSDESPDKAPEADEPPGGCEAAEPEPEIQLYSSLRRESRASSVPGWKSVDRLDNSCASSVLQSPDGNWIALQSSQHLRPSLLAKRKSLVFSVLEKESGVVSAYDEMGSDSDTEDQSSWGVALLQFRRGLSDESYYTDSQHDPEWTYARHHPPVTSPSSGQYTNTETLNSDSEASTAPPTRPRRPTHNIHQRKKGLSDCHPPYMPYTPYRNPPDLTVPPPLRSDTLDVNFNPRVGGDSSEGEERSNEHIRRSRRRRRSKRELAEQSHRAHNSVYSTATPENSALLLNAMMMRRQQSQEAPPPLPPLQYQTPDTVTPPEVFTPGAMTPEPEYQDTVAPNSMAASPPTHNQAAPTKPGPTSQGLRFRASPGNDTMEQELRSKLSELVGQISREDMTSSEDEPIRKVSSREREKESERLRQREREKRMRDGETERSRREMEKESEKRVERQISRERDIIDVVRPRHIEREQERERERQREVERERLLNVEKQREVEWQVEIEKERRREMERQKREQMNGPSLKMDLQEIRKVSAVTENGNDGVIEKGKSIKEGSSATKDNPGEERVKRKLMQRSKSERGSERRSELVELKKTKSMTETTVSSPCGPEEQTSPPESVCEHALQQRLQLLSSLLQQKYSAASLCSITTEVLKVLNATEELIGEAEGKGHDIAESPAGTPLSSCSDGKKLDQHLTKMEENVYLAAGAVYGLEGALSDLEDCARSISSSTTETELAFLENQVATAAAQVQQSELQISDIEARISALKNAGLNVSACSRFVKTKPKPKPQTLDSSRQQRRKLPAPPAREKESKPEPQVRSLRP